MSLCQSIIDTIGRTPLLELKGLEKDLGLNAQIFAKLECFNPGGSIKDRAALSMIKAAQAEGKLQPGGLIVEPTSGNTGIGLALVARALGYRTVLTMPESMSVERRMLLKTYGAEIVLTPAALGMSGAVAKARESLPPLRAPSCPTSLTTRPMPVRTTKPQAPKFGTTCRVALMRL